ncbi:MAG: phosphoribosylformylglycinamidine synthase subunit PurS [Gemmatimonadota bacterium]
MSAWDVEIRITPRPGILDPEGRTIERALGDLGYEGVRSVRCGRLVRVRLEADGETDARGKAHDMCERLIANPVVEDFELHVAPAEDAP